MSLCSELQQTVQAQGSLHQGLLSTPPSLPSWTHLAVFVFLCPTLAELLPWAGTPFKHLLIQLWTSATSSLHAPFRVSLCLVSDVSSAFPQLSLFSLGLKLNCEEFGVGGVTSLFPFILQSAQHMKYLKMFLEGIHYSALMVIYWLKMLS